jgi:hypothetical protein
MAFLAALPVIDELAGVGGAAAAGGEAASAGGLLSRGLGFVKNLLGGGGGSLAQKVGTSLTAHDIASHIEGGGGGQAPQRPHFGTPGYDGVPANLSSNQFGGL